VAGFMGSPSMNFFDATLVSEEGKFYIDSGDFRLIVPDERKNVYADYVGKEVIFGIRPEHVHAPDFASPNIIASPLSATVEVVELLGHEIHLLGSTGKNTLIATIDPRFSANVGNEVQLVADMNNMHLFDKNTELAIR
jgi:multiple sugar transport system ATP-binding protein